jgi:hypothetical protein
MKQEQIINEIGAKLKATIDAFPAMPSFDFSYWKGYCNAIESINNLPANSVYVPVKVIAFEYCDYLRKKNKYNLIK